MAGDAVELERFDPPHREVMGGVAVAEATMGVVDGGRSIHAHAHHDAVALEAVAPGVVDQRAVGLHVLLDHHGTAGELLHAALDDRRGFVVVAAGERERLTGVPHQRQLRPAERALQDPLQQQWQQLQIEHPPLLAIRQIAVIAVEIAEGGGLHHHQPNGAEPAQLEIGMSGAGCRDLAADHQLMKLPGSTLPQPPLPQPPFGQPRFTFTPPP